MYEKLVNDAPMLHHSFIFYILHLCLKVFVDELYMLELDLLLVFGSTSSIQINLVNWHPNYTILRGGCIG